MKRIIAFLMALTMLLGVAAAEDTTVFAAAPLAESTGSSALDGMTLGELPAAVKPELAVGSEGIEASFAGSTDTVVENGSSWKVSTAAGLVFNFSCPNGYALTQDFKQDAYIYNTISNDPKGLYEMLINNDIHMMLFDESLKNVVFVRDCGITELSNAVGNSTSLTVDDAELLAGILASDLGIFRNDVEYGMLGNQVWIAARCEDVIVCLTFVNKHQIIANVEAVNGALGETGYELLDCLNIN